MSLSPISQVTLSIYLDPIATSYTSVNKNINIFYAGLLYRLSNIKDIKVLKKAFGTCLFPHFDFGLIMFEMHETSEIVESKGILKTSPERPAPC